MFAKIRTKLTGFLKQGITPHKLALSFSFGICLGIIPVLGSTTLLCLLAAMIFRLNITITQIVMHLVYPLQLLLFIPYLRWGTFLFSGQKFNYSFVQIVDMFRQDVWNAIVELFWMNMSGLLLWLITTPLVFALIYLICKASFTQVAFRLKTYKSKAQ